jgi:NAD(P)-dependent dehydrogenase (short-subunit alcohol dehydrogenase family)
MATKVCLVTGANGGLGKAMALELAQQGATVILLCRDSAKAEAAQAEIKAKANGAATELLIVDLGSQRSVREAVDQFCQQHTSLDVLINNAAVYKTSRSVTPDGLETMFATNYLGHFLLTNLLLDALQASPSARVINITAPVNPKLDFDNLQSEKHFSTNGAFGASKMCNLLFSNTLATRLTGTHVTSNALHPGLVKSNLLHDAPSFMRVLANLISKSPEQAAQAVAYLALSPDREGVSGKFFKGKTISEPDPYSKDAQVQQRLWKLSADLVSLA